MQTNSASEILRVLDRNLKDDPKFLISGLGVTDPKGVFGTTLGLCEKYGDLRVLETPTSENAMTGVGVGLAISGFRPLMVHQRMDFFILAMDQLINSAANILCSTSSKALIASSPKTSIKLEIMTKH